MLRVLVTDDDIGLRLSVKSALENTGKFHVDEAVDGVDAVERITAGNAPKYDLIVLDVDMPRMSGLQALQKIKEHDPSTIVIMVTAYANINDAVQAVKEGAYNYISKPIRGEDLLAMADKAFEAHALVSSVANSAPVLVEAGKRFIGNNAEMLKVFNIIHRLSKVDTAVLIRGESGTGKELVAKAIHYNSARKNEKFVAINCSAIPENLFESELFGHEKGAFTGADQRKIGKFQYAEGGTIFLDELGDMPLLMQAKILRVLQDKKFTPVGSNRELEANVRVIAATHKPLEKMIELGTFRDDLYYRLSVIPIFLPALRERKDDIDHLVSVFINKFNDSHGKKIIGLTPEAMAVFKKYAWPGNIRELENVIEYAFILENSNKITMQALPEKILKSVGVNLSEPQPQTMDDDEMDITGGDSLEGGMLSNISDDSLDFNKHKEQFEKEFIIKALKAFKGRINQTALHANIPKKTLLRKIEKYGIIAKDYAQIEALKLATVNTLANFG